MIGHSMGGDIVMCFAKEYPDEVKWVVTLDNLRVPFVKHGKFKILSLRSNEGATARGDDAGDSRIDRDINDVWAHCDQFGLVCWKVSRLVAWSVLRVVTRRWLTRSAGRRTRSMPRHLFFWRHGA